MIIASAHHLTLQCFDVKTLDFFLHASCKTPRYRNLDRLHTQLQPLVIRRRKEEVLRELPQELINQLRGMLSMEPVPPPPSAVPSEELPENTPHFLNPEALKSADERVIDVTAEEDAASAQPETPETEQVSAAQSVVGPDKMEEVLNSGMAFIVGLLEMATGRKLEASTPAGRMLHVDPASGEVTLKFKLPGFGGSTAI